MKKRQSSKRYALPTAIALALGVYAYSHVSDDWIRHRVVMLTGNHIACSGEQVRAPSGRDYVLSAGHCMKTAVNNSVTVTTEDGLTLKRQVIAEDPTSDLMLLEGVPGLSGLGIAGSIERPSPVRAFTRGAMQPTYETTGVVIGTGIGKAPTDLDVDHCVGDKYELADADPLSIFLGGGTKQCLLSVEETITTATITGGSSGGPLLNAAGELVGVASMASENFSYWVRLSDIRAFLSGY